MAKEEPIEVEGKVVETDLSKSGTWYSGKLYCFPDHV